MKSIKIYRIIFRDQNLTEDILLLVISHFRLHKIEERVNIEKLRHEPLHIRSDDVQATVPQANGKGRVAEIASLTATARFIAMASVRFDTSKNRRNGRRALKLAIYELRSVEQ